MFKNENGFSLVELAIAAGLAVALAATAVTVLSGTTATLSSNANGAAGTSTQYNTDVLGETGAGSNGGNNNATQSPAAYLASLGLTPEPWTQEPGNEAYGQWSVDNPVVSVNLDTNTYTFYPMSSVGFISGANGDIVDVTAMLDNQQTSYQNDFIGSYGYDGITRTATSVAVYDTASWGGYYEYSWNFSDPYKFATKSIQNTDIISQAYYMVLDANGNPVALYSQN